MKVFIIGHKGWIANMFIKIFNKQNILYTFSDKRAEDDLLLEDIRESKCSHVLCCAGRTHGGSYTTIDYLENPDTFKENLNDNLYIPVKMALFCNRENIHFTYMGTGCIYNYPDMNSYSGKFNEQDSPNFTGSKYSLVKKFTNDILNYIPCLHLRIRMPITYSLHKRNFITKITNYEKICSIPNSMSVMEELIPIAVEFMKNELRETLNFTNPGVISHNEILEMYRNIVHREFSWVNMSIEEQDSLLLSKRSNNHLDTEKLEKYVDMYCPELPFRQIKEAVENALKNYR